MMTSSTHIHTHAHTHTHMHTHEPVSYLNADVNLTHTCSPKQYTRGGKRSTDICNSHLCYCMPLKPAPLTFGCKFVALPEGPEGSEAAVALVTFGPDALVPEHTHLVEGSATMDAVNHPAETKHTQSGDSAAHTFRCRCTYAACMYCMCYICTSQIVIAI